MSLYINQYVTIYQNIANNWLINQYQLITVYLHFGGSLISTLIT